MDVRCATQGEIQRTLCEVIKCQDRTATQVNGCGLERHITVTDFQAVETGERGIAKAVFDLESYTVRRVFQAAKGEKLLKQHAGERKSHVSFPLLNVDCSGVWEDRNI